MGRLIWGYDGIVCFSDHRVVGVSSIKSQVARRKS